MDPLKKTALAVCCLLGVLVANAEEEQKTSEDSAIEKVDGASSQPTPTEETKSESTNPRPSESKATQPAQSQLNRLKLNERIRDEANIDLPQDI